MHSLIDLFGLGIDSFNAYAVFAVCEFYDWTFSVYGFCDEHLQLVVEVFQ